MRKFVFAVAAVVLAISSLSLVGCPAPSIINVAGTFLDTDGTLFQQNVPNGSSQPASAGAVLTVRGSTIVHTQVRINLKPEFGDPITLNFGPDGKPVIDKSAKIAGEDVLLGVLIAFAAIINGGEQLITSPMVVGQQVAIPMGPAVVNVVVTIRTEKGTFWCTLLGPGDGNGNNESNARADIAFTINSTTQSVSLDVHNNQYDLRDLFLGLHKNKIVRIGYFSWLGFDLTGWTELSPNTFVPGAPDVLNLVNIARQLEPNEIVNGNFFAIGEETNPDDPSGHGWYWLDLSKVNSTLNLQQFPPVLGWQIGYFPTNLNQHDSPQDTVAPVITLNGSATVNLTIGQTYSELGATAVDAIDGVCPVSTSGTVNTTIVGNYVLTYSASDLSGNTASVTRLVSVSSSVIPPVVLAPLVEFNRNIPSSTMRIFPGSMSLRDITANASDLPADATFADVNYIGVEIVNLPAPYWFLRELSLGTMTANGWSTNVLFDGIGTDSNGVEKQPVPIQNWVGGHAIPCYTLRTLPGKIYYINTGLNCGKIDGQTMDVDTTGYIIPAN